MTKIYVIHENDAWVEPLRAAFDAGELANDRWPVPRGHGWRQNGGHRH